jgi:hypothetical protein
MNTDKRVEEEMASLKGLRHWMADTLAGQIPEEHKSALGDLLAYLDAMTQKKASARGLTLHFLRAIGVLPKSERSRKYGLGPLAGDLKSKLEAVSRFSLLRLGSLKSNSGNTEASPMQEPPLPLTEPCSESQGKDRLAEEFEKFTKEPEGGEQALTQEAFDKMCEEAFGPQGETDATCVSTPDSESLFGRELEGFVAPREEVRSLSDEQADALKVSPTDTVARTWKSHTRVGFQLVVEETEVKVESAFSRESGAVARADTSGLGPARSRVTWDGLVSLMTLMVGYLVPANRIGLLLGGVGAYFTTARCLAHLRYVAQRLLPVHLAHARALGSARLLQTDDTPARCPEVVRAKSAHEEDPENNPLPWAEWKSKFEVNVKPPAEDAPLARKLAYHLGFANDNKTGGKRKVFNTTVLTGKAREDDLRSFIVLYHSHLGQAGDLLSHLLLQRQSERRGGPEKPTDREQVFLVSDLLKTNPPTSSALGEDFEIVWGGCMHHARRNFVLAADDDYINCTNVRMLFDAIAMYERRLTEVGRREKNVLAVRQLLTGPLWEVIRLQSIALAERWPKGTPVGKAARFVINHFEKLTVHTKHAHMPDNNTLSERMLRPEKLMHGSSLFRWSIEGRAAWNVVRGIYQTCALVGVDFRSYLRHVLITRPEDVAANPDAFTPLAFSRLPKN